MCRSYNPENKLVLYVSICVISEAPAIGAVKWERQLVSRCAKIRISRDTLIPSEKDTEDLETLILTCSPIKGADDKVLRFREIAFNAIQHHLKQRGIVLQQHYPEIFKHLYSYVENICEKFAPVTVCPQDSFTGKSFICVIMPDAEPESIRHMTAASVRISAVNILKD